ncbi:RND efflux membrane fusion protein [Bordetella ansorpii]|uniref:RND efflux membrane fusion protein n=1 Tax=Bordetella ansorpii TaxID=288768 RepID=A0A157SW53_9BORD|nr:efflux RND transporter periplasmic adaptor subunit [Bordetella ansorpii]SAI74692.1 RND efflux membrane fusion protein [Bordetella ansorpii]
MPLRDTRRALPGTLRASVAQAALACLALNASAQAQTPDAPPAAAGMPPAYAASVLAPMSAMGDTGSARAQLVASQRALLSSELAGKIASVPFRDGQSFKKGDVLISYDCALNRARLERAVQAEGAAHKKLAVAEQLEKLSSISRADVDQARAGVAVSRAETGVERVMVNRCTVTAPYAGRVGEAFVRPLESVAEGKELLSIYDNSAFELETIVPSRWLAWLKTGYPMHITVDETGRTYQAVVARIAGTVDPVSQSVKVVGRLDGKTAADLLPGMSGNVRIDPPKP